MGHATRAGISLAAIVFAASGAVTHAAQAQASPVAFGITAGATKATGDLGDAVDLGYHVGGLVQWNGPGLPIGIRGDVVFHRFSVKDDSDKEDILAGTVNGVWMFPMDAGAPVSPYLIGGVGYYHITESCTGCSSSSDNKFGLNGGGGISFPLSGFSAFVEARYHHIFTDGSATSMIPISVGIVFH
jgi:opacity protein-like surface antigen